MLFLNLKIEEIYQGLAPKPWCPPATHREMPNKHTSITSAAPGNGSGKGLAGDLTMQRPCKDHAKTMRGRTAPQQPKVKEIP